jgi:predicted phage tail protein
MKTVQLYGDMGERFGCEFVLDILSPAEAVRALCAMVPGFRAYLQERLEAPFQVLVDDDDQDEQGLYAPVSSREVIKLVPLVAGAHGSFGQVLMGAALILASVYVPGLALWAGASYGTATAIATGVTGLGWGMVLGGVAQMLAKTPNVNAGTLSSDSQTWSFGSPTTTTGQGGSVPLCYGTMRVGGVVISAGITAETWQTGGFGGICTVEDGTQFGDGSATPWSWAVAP